MAQYRIKPWAVSPGGYNYDILNAENQQIARFKAEFSLLNWGDLWDMAGHSLAHVIQRILSLTSEFDITVTGREMLVVKKDSISPLHPTYLIGGPSMSYQLEGNWKNGDYSIHSNGTVAAQVKVETATFGSGYLVETAAGADISTIICLAIVLDEEQWQFQNL